MIDRSEYGESRENDYHIVLGRGPLGFHWQTSAKYFPELSRQWAVNIDAISQRGAKHP
jgi:hypothetical protein